MYQRFIGAHLKRVWTQYPIISITGPRQSGKTTLSRHLFDDLPYVNLEDLSVRQYAQEDPKGFLADYPKGAILDEVQGVPDLFSYLQVIVDEKNTPSQYVLLGSQQFLLNERINQSLAGRVMPTRLLPLSYQELQTNTAAVDLYTLLFKGGYPRLWGFDLAPTTFYAAYAETYLERDVRALKNIGNLALFQKFVQLCAGRVGQLLNITNLAQDCGITRQTAESWLSLLEASFIIYRLQPHHNNFSKRLVKSKKLYFYDTGLLCYLLNLRAPEDLRQHFAQGAIFENFIFSEIMKASLSKGIVPKLSFWRDKSGTEVDFILDKGISALPIEVKLGQTLQSSFFKNTRAWMQLSGQATGWLVYGGQESQKRHDIEALGWSDFCSRIFDVC